MFEDDGDVVATDAELLRDEVISRGEEVVGDVVALLLLCASSWSAFSPPSILALISSNFKI